MIKQFIAASTLVATVSGFACSIDGKEGFLPDNDLYISTSSKSKNLTMDEKTFNDVIDKVEAIYAPIISSMGATLNVERNWDDGTVNAYASQSGNTWNVAMFGGLARHEAITPDGFALVVCHELGHHIGGAPKKSSWWTGKSWATNEGQADYFATLKCLRKVFRAENNAEIVAKLDVPETVQTTCAEQFSEQIDQQICQRGAMAGMSTAKLFQSLRNSTTTPDFKTPDTKVVRKTDHNHPAFQCRLDTYFQGALCTIDENIDVDQDDESVGVCYRAAGDQIGIRPLCWFKPERS